MKPNGFALPILILAITGIAAIGVGSYLLYQNQNKSVPIVVSPPTPSPTTSTPKESTSPRDMSNWKIYLNNEYRFSFQYPNYLSAPKIMDENGYIQYIFLKDDEMDDHLTAGVYQTKTGQRLPEVFDNPKSQSMPKFTTKSGEVGINAYGTADNFGVVFRQNQNANEIVLACHVKSFPIADSGRLGKDCNSILSTFRFLP